MLTSRNKNFAKLSLLLWNLGNISSVLVSFFFSFTKVAKIKHWRIAKFRFRESFVATLPRAGLRAHAPRCATALALATNSSARCTSRSMREYLIFLSFFFLNFYLFKGQWPRDSVADPCPYSTDSDPGPRDPCLCLMDPDADPDPAISVTDLQDAAKKLI
jgi:hypothetical protein